MLEKISTFILLFNFSFVCYGHSVGQPLTHNRTLVNCARYRREANQHSCVLAPFTTEGPYFLSDDLERANIIDGEPGINLDLNLRLTNSKDCSPLSNYFVHVWHANATGHYSGVEEFNEFPEPSYRPKPITNERWLRGYQVTNEFGEVNFQTIIPGWYYGRALHIHVEVYSSNNTDGNSISYIGQLYFKQEMPIELKLIEPYLNNNNQMMLNDADDAFILTNGKDTVIDLIQKDNGFKTSFTMAIDPSVTTTYDDIWA